MICPKECKGEKPQATTRTKYGNHNEVIAYMEYYTCPMCGYKWRELDWDESLEPLSI